MVPLIPRDPVPFSDLLLSLISDHVLLLLTVCQTGLFAKSEISHHSGVWAVQNQGPHPVRTSLLQHLMAKVNGQEEHVRDAEEKGPVLASEIHFPWPWHEAVREIRIHGLIWKDSSLLISLWQLDFSMCFERDSTQATSGTSHWLSYQNSVSLSLCSLLSVCLSLFISLCVSLFLHTRVHVHTHIHALYWFTFCPYQVLSVSWPFLGIILFRYFLLSLFLSFTWPNPTQFSGLRKEITFPVSYSFTSQAG